MLWLTAYMYASLGRMLAVGTIQSHSGAALPKFMSSHYPVWISGTLFVVLVARLALGATLLTGFRAMLRQFS